MHFLGIILPKHLRNALWWMTYFSTWSGHSLLIPKSPSCCHITIKILVCYLKFYFYLDNYAKKLQDSCELVHYLNNWKFFRASADQLLEALSERQGEEIRERWANALMVWSSWYWMTSKKKQRNTIFILFLMQSLTLEGD